MKFYIAARFTQKEAVRHLQQKLIALGHELTYDWTVHSDARPFSQNTSLATMYAKKDIDGVKASDVFIALCDHLAGGTGTHTEIGAAISSYIDHGKPKVYVVGLENSEAMFYFHPCVKRCKDIDEVLRELC